MIGCVCSLPKSARTWFAVDANALRLCASVDDLEDYDEAIIVAGSRGFNDYMQFCAFLEDRLSHKDLVDKRIIFITGMASSGADELIVRWCVANNMPFVPFEADWSNIDVPGAIIRLDRSGKPYNAKAGHDRNEVMAEYGTRLICFYDGRSPGTRDMIRRAKAKDIPTSVYLIDVTRKLP